MQERSLGESVNMKMKENETREMNNELVNEQGLRCYRTEEIYHGTKTKLSFCVLF